MFFERDLNMRMTESRLRRIIRGVLNEMFDVDDVQTMDSEIGKHKSGGKLLTNQEFQKALDYFREFKDDAEVKNARYHLMRLVLNPDNAENNQTLDAIEGVLKDALGDKRGDLSLWLDFGGIMGDKQSQQLAVDTLRNLYDALVKSSASHSHGSTFSDASFYPRRTFGGPTKRKKY